MNDNERFMDALSMVSFLLGVANYNENLSQSDKDDIMRNLDEKTNVMLRCMKEEMQKQNEMLEYQNNMLERIIKLLKE